MREVEARLRLSAVDRTQRAFDSVQRRLNAVEKQTSAANRAQLAFNRTVAALPRGIAAGVLAYEGVQAVKAFAVVERQLTRTGLTLGATREEMSALRNDVYATSKAYGLPMEEVQSMIDAYVAAGASMSDVRHDLDMLGRAQLALGSTGADTVSTWDAARKSLKLTTKDATRFFEIVAAGSAAGKFEAADMAQYLPGLLPVAARQGFLGTEGAERIVGFLEVMRDFVGESSEAVSSTADFLDKISSPTVENAFRRVGIPLRDRLKEARDNGEDILEVMHKLLVQATGGDASRLGEFFADKEARRAAAVILELMDRVRNAQDQIHKNAPGVLDRNNTELLKDSDAALTRIEATYERLKQNAGELLVELGTVDQADAFATDLERLIYALKGGWTPWDSLKALLPGGESPTEVVDRFAGAGGRRWKSTPLSGQGPMEDSPELPSRRQDGANALSADDLPDSLDVLPSARPDPDWNFLPDLSYPPFPTIGEGWLEERSADTKRRRENWKMLHDAGLTTGDSNYDTFQAAARHAEPATGSIIDGLVDTLRDYFGRTVTPPPPTFRETEEASMDALRRDHNAIANEIETALSGGSDRAGAAIEKGGEAAGQSIAEAARALNEAGGKVGADASAAFLSGMDGIAASFGAKAAASFNANVKVPGGTLPAASVNKGRTMAGAGGVINRGME